MVCLGFVLGNTGLKAQTNPLSYGGHLRNNPTLKKLYSMSKPNSEFKVKRDAATKEKNIDFIVQMSKQKNRKLKTLNKGRYHKQILD